MATKLKGVRNPFMCPCCGVLYSSSIHSSSAPKVLQGCGHTLCADCVLNKKEQSESERGSRNCTIDCAVCGVETNCVMWSPAHARPIIDLLLELEEKAKRAYFSNVAIEPKDLSALKCYECKAQYSRNKECHVSFLGCGHTLCWKCMWKEIKKKVKEEEEYHVNHFIKIWCARCEDNSIFRGKSYQGAFLEDIIRWLETKKEEQIQSHPRNMFNCADCGLMTRCDRGFMCTSCTEDNGGEERVLCAFCTHDVAHEGHAFEKLLPAKLRILMDEVLSDHENKLAKSKIDANLAVDLYKTLMENVEERFSTAIRTIPVVTKCSDGMTIAINLREKTEQFERIMERIVPNLRYNNQMLENMICQLTETFPELAKDIGESEVKEETQLQKTVDGESMADEEDAKKTTNREKCRKKLKATA